MAITRQEAVVPLFPLPMAPLPGEPLPLYIFEPRYRALLAHCQSAEGSQSFGIVLSREGELSRVGCVVQVVSVLEEFADGRSVILTVATERFELLEVLRSEPFPLARVRVLADGSETVDLLLREQALDQFRALLQLGGMTIDASAMLPDEISFQLAALLRLDQGERQELLLFEEENQRLEYVRSLIAFRTTVLQKSPAAYASVNSDDPNSILQ